MGEKQTGTERQTDRLADRPSMNTSCSERAYNMCLQDEANKICLVIVFVFYIAFPVKTTGLAIPMFTLKKNRYFDIKKRKDGKRDGINTSDRIHFH